MDPTSAPFPAPPIPAHGARAPTTGAPTTGAPTTGAATTRVPAGDRPPRQLLAAALAVLAGTLIAGPLAGNVVLYAAVGLALFAGARSARIAGLPVAALVGLGLAAGVRAFEGSPASADEGPTRWQAARTVDGKTRGLAGGVRLRVAAGVLRDGELVRVLGPGRTIERASGPRDSGPQLVRIDLAPDELERLAAGGPEPWLPHMGHGGALARVRALGVARAARLEDPLARSLAQALAFGDRSGLPAPIVDLFTRTGTRHLLALSGLHVAIVAWWLAGPLAALAARVANNIIGPRVPFGVRVAPGPLRGLCTLALVPLGGGGAPVVRAAITLAVAGLAAHVPARWSADGRERGAESGAEWGVRRGVGRGVDPLSLWSLALLVELSVRPSSVRDVGVALSYSATLALIVAARPAAAMLRGRLPTAGRISPVGRFGRPRSGWWRIPAQRMLDALIDGIAASAVAVLGTLPLAWERFAEIAPIGVLVTPLVLPLVALLLVASWAEVVLPGVSAGLGVELPAAALVGTLTAFDRIPGTPLPLPPRPSLIVVAAAATGLLALVAWGGRTRVPRRAARKLARCAAAAGGVALLPWALAPRGLTVCALAVGHGTAVLVRAPGGTWLFDAGSRDRLGVGRNAVAPLLARWEVGSLAGVVLSHAHRDHIGAVPWIVDRWPADLWVGAVCAQAGERHPHARAPVDLDRGRMELPTAEDPDTGALTLALLRGCPEPGNEGSRNLELRYAGRRLLLFGDAEEEGLEPLLRREDQRGPLELCLLPHHGSAFTHLATLLSGQPPQRVWVSGPERPELADELDRRGLDWASTAGGALELVLAPKSVPGTDRAGRPPWGRLRPR